jgi:hypothetical protein
MVEDIRPALEALFHALFRLFVTVNIRVVDLFAHEEARRPASAGLL